MIYLFTPIIPKKKVPYFHLRWFYKWLIASPLQVPCNCPIEMDDSYFVSYFHSDCWLKAFSPTPHSEDCIDSRGQYHFPNIQSLIVSGLVVSPIVLLVVHGGVRVTAFQAVFDLSGTSKRQSNSSLMPRRGCPFSDFLPRWRGIAIPGLNHIGLILLESIHGLFQVGRLYAVVLYDFGGFNVTPQILFHSFCKNRYLCKDVGYPHNRTWT